MTEEENYFRDGKCLFCERPAMEDHYGNHGRDSRWICECHERAAWNKAKLDLSQSERLAKARLLLINDSLKVRNAERELRALKNTVENTEKLIFMIQSK